jgi:hypothetical protein
LKLLHIGYFIFSILLLTSNYSFSQPALSLKDNSYTYLKSNLEFLASDELEGREATTRGEKLAGLFISEELEKYGVLPFGDSGTYFQNFNMIVSGFNENSYSVFIDRNSDSIVFANGSDAVFSPRSLPNDKYNNKEFEIVFAGYGVFSEEDNYDSYANLDMTNKVALILNGTPMLDGKEVLSEDTYKKFRRSTTAKAELAKSKGAVGLIILPDDETITYWEFIQNWANSKTFKLEEEVVETNFNNIPILLLNNKSAELLLKNEKLSFDSISNIVEPAPKSYYLSKKIKFSYDILLENRIARNVIGLVKGNNNNLKNEYLTIGAHYDHVGLINNEIYNGADDNGSGTVAILEIARLLSLTKENQRPVVVIFHTAEEKGLKGAKYLTNNSEFIKDALVHINLDMIGRKSEDSVYCIGASKISSELGTLIAEVNENTTKLVLDYSFDDPNDTQRLYYRSDHIHYARKGIPIAFFYDYMKDDYHKPTDDVEKINFDKVMKVTELIYNLLLKISNLDHKLTVDNVSLN